MYYALYITSDTSHIFLVGFTNVTLWSQTKKHNVNSVINNKHCQQAGITTVGLYISKMVTYILCNITVIACNNTHKALESVIQTDTFVCL